MPRATAWICVTAVATALRALRGETWGVLMGAFPQVVPAGEPSGGEVQVDIMCSGAKGAMELSGASEGGGES